MIRLVHEVPGRLRFHVPFLSAAGPEVRHLRARLEGVAGIEEVRVNAGARSLIVRHDGKPGSRERVVRAVSVLRPDDLPSAPGISGQSPPDLSRPILSGLAAVAHPFLPPALRHLVTAANVSRTLVKGAASLIDEGLTVEVLDAAAIGLAAARGEHFTANATQFLLDLGEYLEQSTARHSDELLRRLLKPNAETAWVERDGEVKKIPFAQVAVGERVVVGAGDMVPVDGIVAEGEATVNQSSVTGESLPIPKEPGIDVLAGTVVEDGRLVIVAERVGDATTTARIARFIEEALEQRSASQQLAEDLANKRVVITLATAAAVYALTRDPKRVEAVFLVDYSCALKLGTPVAIKSAMYRAARRGILVKGAHAIEALAKADTVVFDKTGTLTRGKLEVTDVIPFDTDHWGREDFLAMVASVEEHTTHPVAAAVVKMAHIHDLAHIGHAEVDFIVGHGLGTRVGGRNIRIGSRHYLQEHAMTDFGNHEDTIRALETEGKTLLYVGGDGEPLGIIALRDTVRNETPATLRRLRRAGIERIVMLTGDREGAARTLAAELGIDEVFWEAAPEDKADIVGRLQREGRTVAFVGDGVNDGPALTAAHVGLSMPLAADLARASADIVLMKDCLEHVAEAREVACGTMALIRGNFDATVTANTAILAGASLGLLPPLATALLHNGTTLAILLNALAGGGAAVRGSLSSVRGNPETRF